MSIAENFIQVRERIARAAERAGRKPEEIRLIAVSKTMPVVIVQEAYNAGQRIFGENRVQEWLEKAPALPEDCEWHLIGRLQTNKVKYLNDRICLIHSLDRLSLLEALEEQGRKRGLVWNTLLQVNVARDPAKAGVLPEEAKDFLDRVAECSHVRVRGLMTIGALEASADETRGFFRELKSLRDELQKHTWPGVDLCELSMGMSGDYEMAIEEGATMIRVGRSLFGERAQ